MLNWMYFYIGILDDTCVEHEVVLITPKHFIFIFFCNLLWIKKSHKNVSSKKLFYNIFIASFTWRLDVNRNSYALNMCIYIYIY